MGSRVHANECGGIFSLALCSLATDIVADRLELAKKLGADVIINCKTEDLKERGENCRVQCNVSIPTISCWFV